jgi:hypothetical protein
MGLLGLPHTMFISGHRHRKAWLMFNKGQCGANKNWRSISKMNGKTNCSVATYLIRSVRHFIHGHDKFSKLIYNILPNLHSNRPLTRLGLFCFCVHYISLELGLPQHHPWKIYFCRIHTHAKVKKFGGQHYQCNVERINMNHL